MDLPYLFDNHLRAGLPPEGRVPVNEVFMEYMHNAKSMPVGAVFPEKITAPSAETLAFPYPQFIRGERGDFILGASTIKRRAGRTGSFSALSTYDALTPASSATIASSGPWQLVSQEKLWLASNLNQLVFSIPSNTSGKVLVSGRNVRALGKHGRRLMLGGVNETDGSGWFSGSRWTHVMDMWRHFQPQAALGHENMTWDLSWIVYMEPGGGADDIPYHIGLAMLGCFGNTLFDYWLPFIDTYLESGEIGLIPSKANSSIFAIKELNDPSRVIVYGPDAITELTPEGSRYEEHTISNLGILGRAAVGGSTIAHAAVDSQKHLVVVDNQGLRRFNHSDKLPSSASSIVSYDETFGDFWITDGSNSWIYNGALSGPIDVCPTGLVRDLAAGLIGFATHQAETSYSWELRFVPVDFGDRDWDKITTMMFEAVGLTAIEMKVDSRFSGDGDWFNGPWIPAFTKNYATASKSGVELRVSFRGTTTLADPARLSSLEARYVGNAGNVRRGPAPRRG